MRRLLREINGTIEHVSCTDEVLFNAHPQQTLWLSEIRPEYRN
jgi:hypothetical protein